MPFEHPALALDPDRVINQYQHRIWQTEDGLPQDSVESIIQTRDGYLWVATQDGLARFDGVHFTTFNKENTPGITSNNLTSLFEDRAGNLWIGTMGGGMLRLRNGIVTPFTRSEGLPANHVICFYEDQPGNLWIGTLGGGLNRFKDGIFKTYDTSAGLSDNRVRCIYQDQEGTFWIGTDNGLNRWKNGLFTVYKTQQGLSDNGILSIRDDRAGNLWIGTRNGLSRLTQGKFTIYNGGDGLSGHIARFIREDRSGNLWIGTVGGGLNRFREGEFTSYTAKDGLSNDAVLSIFEDREGSLWVGTDGGGLNQLRDGTITAYTTQEGLSDEVVNSIVEDRAGNLWVGTAGGVVNNFTSGQFSHSKTRTELPGGEITAMGADQHGGVWIGTRKGVSRLYQGSLTNYTTRDGLLDNHVSAILEDTEGHLWIGTRSGLNRWNNGRFESFTSQSGLPAESIVCLALGRDGTLWVGTDGQLSKWQQGRLVALNSDTVYKGVSGISPSSVHEDSNGALWVSTFESGLLRLMDGKVTQYRVKDGLLADNLFQILDDARGNFWISSNKGLFRVARKDLEEFAAGRESSIASFPYGRTDGVKSGCSEGHACKTRDGKLWFPTYKGVLRIDPDKVIDKDVPIPAVLEQIIVDGKATPLQPDRRLSPGKEKFEFHYSALTYRAPERLRFRYRLEGFDKEWVDGGSRRIAYYTHIPPGPYRFVVTTRNENGVWNQSTASYSFYVEPHFYRTYWFYSVVGLFLVTGVGGLSRLRDRKLKARERELAKRVEERTAQLTDEIIVRQQTELELTLERELMDSLMESIPDIIFFKDTDGRIIKTNQAHADLFHLGSVSEMIGKTDFDFHSVENARGYFEQEQQIIKTGQALIGHVQRDQRPDGRTTWYLVTKMPLQDKEGKIIGTFGTSKDVTALKEAEEALVQAEKKYRGIFENATDGIFQTDLAGRYLSANPALAWIYGYESSNELMAEVTQVGEQLYVEPGRRKAFEELMRQQDAVWDFVSQVRRKDGEVIWVSENGRAVRDEAGNPHHFEGFVKDITEKKKAEGELEAAHQQLLETSRQAGMAEVATAVLHNVGNVLNSVNVSASLMADAIRKSKLPGLDKAIGLMNAQSARLGDFLTQDPKGKQLPDYLKKLADHLGTEQAGMLRELGSLAKNIEHIKDIVTMQQAYARVSGVAESIAPADLVDDALRMNTGALTRHDVQVIREYSELPKILVEKHKVLQILVNLISNAKYAMDEGNPPLKQLVMRMGMNGNGHFKIAVIDNGVGISAENLTRIFAHGFTTKKTGHGFGLHSAALAAQEMGGSLQVHSEGVGKGATFTLELPLNLGEEVHG